MTTRVDLKGWWIVDDAGAETVVRQIEGVLEYAPQKCVALNPNDGSVAILNLEGWGVELFRPSDEAAARRRAAEIIAENAALDAEEVDAETKPEAA
jgi:hypothetical protein